MILAKLFSSGDKLVGFEISGHSGYAEEGSDIICASVSSCAYMVVNTVTDVYHIDADIELRDGFLNLLVPVSRAGELQKLFSGFELHLKALAEDYKSFLKAENEIINK